MIDNVLARTNVEYWIITNRTELHYLDYAIPVFIENLGKRPQFFDTF